MSTLRPSNAFPGAVCGPQRPAAEPTGQDKRQTPRLGLERMVHIEAANGPPIPCTLSDVSKTGARVTVSDPAALPDEFALLLKDDLRKWCRIVRRSEKHVGVKFIATPEPAPAA